jgi:hypothetical protein
MKIHFEGLEFECVPIGSVIAHGSYDDWIPCKVRVRVPHFEGSFRWDALAGEIASFIEELENANQSLGERKIVRFAAIESNVTLEFTFNEKGQIEGEYRFRGESSGFEPQLAGRFSADQTFVSQVVNGFRSLVVEARAASD